MATFSYRTSKRRKCSTGSSSPNFPTVPPEKSTSSRGEGDKQTAWNLITDSPRDRPVGSSSSRPLSKPVTLAAIADDEKLLRCKTCGNGFRHRQNLQLHMNVHKKDNPYKCKVCGKNFSKWGNLRVHLSVHTGEKPFQCQVCSKKFRRDRERRVHMRVHTGEKPFQCEICRKRFGRINSLRIHGRLHTGDKPFECKECGRTFRHNGTLLSHAKLHARSADPFQKKRRLKKSRERAATRRSTQKRSQNSHGEETKARNCRYCGRSFEDMSSLRVHIESHLKTKFCGICNNTFTSRVKFRRHGLMHTGGKTFVCKDCGKTFSQKSHFVCHLRIHHDEMPYTCGFCHRHFRQRSTVQRHVNTVHKMQKKRSGCHIIHRKRDGRFLFGLLVGLCLSDKRCLSALPWLSSIFLQSVI